MSSSQIQTGRETVVLIYAFAAFVAVGLTVFPIVNTVSINALKKLPLTPTVRILVEIGLSASIALPMGIYPKLSHHERAGRAWHYRRVARATFRCGWTSPALCGWISSGLRRLSSS